MSINFENEEICCVRPRQCLTTPTCGAPGPVDSIYESHLGSIEDMICHTSETRPSPAPCLHVASRGPGSPVLQWQYLATWSPLTLIISTLALQGPGSSGEDPNYLLVLTSLQVFGFSICYRLEGKHKRVQRGHPRITSF